MSTHPNSRSFDFRRLIAEFAIIVTGVLTALAVDSCAEGRHERGLEKQYLRQIENDLTANVKALDGAQIFFEHLTTRAQAGLAVLGQSRPSAQPNQDLINLYQASRLELPNLVETTYQELVSSGNLRLIDNAELRDQLVQYYLSSDGYLNKFSAWQDRTPYRDRLRRTIPAQLQLSIASSCSINVQDVRTCKDFEIPDDARAAIASLYSDAELKRDLNLWVSAQPSIAGRTRQQRVATERLLEKVRAELI